MANYKFEGQVKKREGVREGVREEVREGVREKYVGGRKRGGRGEVCKKKRDGEGESGCNITETSVVRDLLIMCFKTSQHLCSCPG